jgi:hypothetical protein
MVSRIAHRRNSSEWPTDSFELFVVGIFSENGVESVNTGWKVAQPRKGERIACFRGSGTKSEQLSVE